MSPRVGDSFKYLIRSNKHKERELFSIILFKVFYHVSTIETFGYGEKDGVRFTVEYLKPIFYGFMVSFSMQTHCMNPRRTAGEAKSTHAQTYSDRV